MTIRKVSALLISSYIVDWIVLILLAAVGAGFSQIEPRKRPFDITDRSISYPLKPETITNSTLLITTLLAPAAVILIGSLLIPFDTSSPSKKAPFQRKLWEWNTGWLGLALSYVIALGVTNGTKEVLGKPRPNLLARCNPDLSSKLNFTAGGIGDQVEAGIHLFDWRICRNRGALLDEGFRSFPSGHSSLAFAGLLYLALWLCCKCGVAIPLLNSPHLSALLHFQSRKRQQWSPASLRKVAAAPPVYLVIFPLTPIGGAIFITSTRYSDYWHHGFDVLMSAILGTLTAWLGFRWYHMPVQTGGGWAWAPRGRKRAYWKGIGSLTYAESDNEKRNDIETGDASGSDQHVRTPGLGSERQDTSDGSGGSYEMYNLPGTAQTPTDLTVNMGVRGVHGQTR